MQNVIPIHAAITTMSSRDISALTGSQHKNVVRSIERLKIAGNLTAPPEPSPYDHRGNTYREYFLQKNDCLVVVAQLCPGFLVAIVNRWQELESKQFQVPRNMAEALRLAADQAEKIEEQAAKIQKDAPKIAYVDEYMNSSGLRGLQEAAKSLDFKPRQFTEALKSDGFLYYLGAGLVAYQKYIDKGLFKQVEGIGQGGHDFKQTKITTTGMAYFAHRYATELIE